MSKAVYFDTEFTTLGPGASLISVGCFAEDGEAFYAELSDTWVEENCSSFVCDIVLPLLEGGAHRMTEATLAKQLQAWVEKLTDDEVVFRSDCPSVDWHWLLDLFTFYNCWPKNLRRRCGTIYFETPAQQHSYNTGLEAYWKDHIDRQHHALVDARSLHYAWKYAMGYHYMMVFESSQLDGALVIEDALKLIGNL